jgi:hypothetical protein
MAFRRVILGASVGISGYGVSIRVSAGYYRAWIISFVYTRAFYNA